MDFGRGDDVGSFAGPLECSAYGRGDEGVFLDAEHLGQLERGAPHLAQLVGTAFKDVTKASGGEISAGHAIVDLLIEVVINFKMACRFVSVASWEMD